MERCGGAGRRVTMLFSSSEFPMSVLKKEKKIKKAYQNGGGVEGI